MDREITISTAFGTNPSLDHNAREKEFVKNQSHIDPNGVHETWKNESPEKAYEEVFGSAVRAYDEEQTRADRRIGNYYESVRAEEAEYKNKSALKRQAEASEGKKGGRARGYHPPHALYEVIVQIGNRGSYEEDFTLDESKAVLKEFYKKFEKANPNFHVVQACFHADEEGAPHLHLVYFPFADGFKKGPSRHNSLSGALEKEGFKSDTKKHRDGEKWATAQRKWEQSCTDTLADICTGHGFEVVSRNVGYSHMSTEMFKAFASYMESEGYSSETVNSYYDEYIQALSEASEAKERAERAEESKKTAEESKKAVEDDKKAVEAERDFYKNARDNLMSRADGGDKWESLLSDIPEDMAKTIRGEAKALTDFMKRKGTRQQWDDFMRYVWNPSHRGGKGDDFYK